MAREALTPPQTPAPARSLLASAALTTQFAKTASAPGKRPRPRAAPPVPGPKFYNPGPAKIVRRDPSRASTSYLAWLNPPVKSTTGPALTNSLRERAGARAPAALRETTTKSASTVLESASSSPEPPALPSALLVLGPKFCNQERAKNVQQISYQVLIKYLVWLVQLNTVTEALLWLRINASVLLTVSLVQIIRCALIAGGLEKQFWEANVFRALHLRYSNKEHAKMQPQLQRVLEQKFSQAENARNVLLTTFHPQINQHVQRVPQSSSTGLSTFQLERASVHKSSVSMVLIIIFVRIAGETARQSGSPVVLLVLLAVSSILLRTSASRLPLSFLRTNLGGSWASRSSRSLFCC
ncbi:Hypothetical_protein [Hexamita inflata]|uniref:Hypothetical_protein n=1 Tax=Hexamita inflata TaxID=28002 RepID=A0ABP1J9X5_9EUKA